jgi:hypothetical protein
MATDRASIAHLERAMRNNELFAMNLKQGLEAIPKKVLGVLAATALDRSIRKTKHDSSRAAANWDLSIGGTGIRQALSPSSYKQSGDSWGDIGERYDAGDYENFVLAAKALFYGYGEPGVTARGSESVFLEPEKGGRLASSLRIGQSGEAPSVYLFNPVMTMANARMDKAGHTYAYNAFFGSEAGPEMAQSTVQMIGNGYVPYLVKQINQQVKWAFANKTYWNATFG